MLCSWQITVKGVTHNQISCNEFLNWINSNDLSCMPFTGTCYTWCNGRRGLHTRLDRALSNGVCLDEWDSCTYQVLVKIVLIIPLYLLVLLVIIQGRLAIFVSFLCGFRTNHV